MKILSLVGFLFFALTGGALAACPVPNPNLIAVPGTFVDNCPVPASTMNKLGFITSPATGQISANAGAVINRLGDRIFVGKNTNVNDGNVPSVVKDWLETIFSGTTSLATIGALGTSGLDGVMGGVRTSEAADGAFTTGIIGVCIDDATFLAPNACTGGYFETEHTIGSGKNYAQGVEIDIDELNGPGGGYPVQFQPYTSPFPSGETDALRLGSGGSRPGAQPASTAIAIINNTAQFRSGIVFQDSCCLGTFGSGGVGEAIAMAKGHEINWYSPDGNVATTLYSIGDTGQATAVFALGNGGMSITSSAYASLALAAPTGSGSQIFFINNATNKYLMGVDGTGANFIIQDQITSNDAMTIISGNLTLGEVSANLKLIGAVQFGSSASWNANGSVATTMTSLGPTGSHTTIQEWLTVVDSAGVVRYVPAY